MPRKPLTPEEKLFAIIQKTGGAESSGTGRSARAARASAQLTRLLGGVRVALTDVKQINRLLLAAVIVLALIGIVLPWVDRPNVSRIVAEASQSPTPLVIPPPLAHLKPVEEQEALVRERNPFGLQPEPSPTPPAPPVAAAPSDEQVLREDFRLVGIVWAEQPIAMIEQAKTGRTYPVKAGEPLGDFIVKKVLKDRVIFEINGKELELF